MAATKFSQDRRTFVLALVTDKGISTVEIAQALGLKRTENVCDAMKKLEGEGLVFGFRTCKDGESRWCTVYFKTRTARDLAVADRKELSLARDKVWRQLPEQVAKRKAWVKAKRQKERAAVAQKQAEARALRAAERELAKVRARQLKEAAAAEKARAKVEAQKQRDRLKAQTRAAGQLKPQRGTTTPPAAPKPKGPAHIVGELDLSQAKVIKLPGAPESRWDTSGAKSVVNSSQCRAWARAAA